MSSPIPIELGYPLEGTAISSSALQIITGSQSIFAYSVTNPNAYPVYLWFYDSLAANVNPRTSVPVTGSSITVPASANGILGLATNYNISNMSFSTAISVRATANNNSSDVISPATSPILEIQLAAVAAQTTVNLPSTTNLIAGDGAGNGVDTGIVPSTVLTNPAARTAIDYTETNLAGGTSLTIGGIYYDTLSSDRTISIVSSTNNPVNNSQPPTILRLTVDANGPYNLTIPSSYSEGDSGTLVKRILPQNTDHEFVWVYSNLHGGSYLLADTTSGVNISPPQLSGNVNDYSPIDMNLAATLRIDGGGADRTITGLANGIPGRVIRIVNVGATNNLILSNNNSSSAAGNRFKLGTGNINIPLNGTVALEYDVLSQGWRPSISQLVNSGVAAGTYGDSTHSSQVTVGVDGRVTSASSVALSIGGTVNSGTTAQLAYYASSGTAVSGLTTANSGLLVTDGSGNPSISTTIPNGVLAFQQSAFDNSTKVATTNYVDSGRRVYPAGAVPTQDVGLFTVSNTSAFTFGSGTTSTGQTIFTVPTGRTFLATSAWVVWTNVGAGGSAGTCVWKIIDSNTGLAMLNQNGTVSSSITPALNKVLCVAGITGSQNVTCTAPNNVQLSVTSAQASATANGTMYVQGFYTS